MPTEQLLTYTGKAQQTAVTSFKAENLAGVKHVKIKLGNPMGKTYSGRIEAARILLERQQINAQQYMEILQNGSLQTVEQDGNAETNLIAREDEMLADGIAVPVSPFDNHPLHIEARKKLLMRPEIRSNADLIELIGKDITTRLGLIEQMAVDNPQALAIALGKELPLPVPNPATGIGPQANQPMEGEVPMGEGGEELVAGEEPMDELAGQAQARAESELQEGSELMNQ